MKPLTTVGDALMAKGGNWRADLRAAEIPRRTPPPSRPDRGYVEQPEERVEAKKPPPTTTQFPPRRREETPVLTAPVALIRLTMPPPEPAVEMRETRPEPEQKPQSALGQLLAEHIAESLPPPTVSTEPSQPEEPPPPAAPSSKAKELHERIASQMVARRETEVRHTKRGPDRKKRVSTPLDARIAAVGRVLRGEISAKETAAQMGVSDSVVSLWCRLYKPPQPIEKTEEEMPRGVKASKVKRLVLSTESKMDAVKRIVGGHARVSDIEAETGASSSNISRWVQQYRKNGTVPGRPGGAPVSVATYIPPVSRTMVSSSGGGRAPMSGPPSIPGDAPPLPTIRVGGFDNPTFEIHGLQAYIEYMVRLGVKAELTRRLRDD